MASVLAFSSRQSRARRPPEPQDLVSDAAPQAADLVRRIQAGDRRAEEILVETYGEGLAFLVRRWTRDRETAADLCQETLSRAIEKLRRGELRDPASLPSFLRGLAWNLSIDHYRRQSRHSEREAPLHAALDPPDPGPGPLASLLRQEKIGLARRLLDELPIERDRLVLLRFYLEEEDKERIEADLGLTRAEFNMVLFRARRRYQALFEAVLGGRRDS